VDVAGKTYQLAPDVEITGTGFNRIASRNGRDWYSINDLPPDFLMSGDSAAIRGDWQTSLIPAGGTAPGVVPGQASLLGLPWWVWAGLAVGLVFMLKAKGARSWQ
jgi:hypothetical protein